MAEASMTPMLRQYRQLKQRCPGALVFYRLGDFCELFRPGGVGQLTGSRFCGRTCASCWMG